MIDKNLVKRIMKSITRREIGLSDHEIMHPVREWFLSLAIASLFLGVAVFLCAKLYWYYSSLQPSSNLDTNTPIVIYQAEEVETALTEFAARKKAHEELKALLMASAKKSTINIQSATSTFNLSTSTPEEQTNETTDEVLIETPTIGAQ